MNFMSARRSSMYTRFLASFAIILIIPLTSSIFSYLYSLDQLKNEIRKSNTTALSQFYNQLEARFGSASTIINQIDIDNDTIKFKEYDAQKRMLSGYITYTNRNYLSTLKTDYMEDIFVYYPNSDKIVSAYNSTLSSNLYYEAIYSNVKLYPEWKEMLSVQNVYSVVAINNKDYKTLAVAHSLPLGSDGNITAAEVCVFSGSYITGLIKSYADLIQGGVVIFDKNDNILISSDEAYELVNMGAYEGSPDYYYDKLNKNEYVIQVAKSEITACKYVFIVPAGRFWSELTVFKARGKINILFFVFIEMLIAWLLSKKNYQPISRLVNYIVNCTNKTYKHGSKLELDFISDMFSSALKENKNLTHKLESMYSIRQKNFITNILHGNYPRNSELYEAFLNNNISLLSNMFLVIICKIEGWDHSVISDIYEEIIEEKASIKNATIIEIITKNVLEELCARNHKGLVLRIEKDMFACLLNLRQTSIFNMEQCENEMINICTTAKQFFEKNLGIYCTISYSNAHKDFEGIETSYTEAMNALEYRIVYGERALLSYKIAEAADYEYNYNFRTIAENVLIYYIKTGEPACSDILDKIITECFANGKISPQTAKIFMYDMSNVILKAVNILSLQTPFYSLNSSNGSLILCETIPQYREQLLLILPELNKFYQFNHRPNELSKKITDFVNMNYMDVDLNVNKIGYYFNISPSYCSKILKQQTGLNILDYISKMRMENARRLLRDTELSIEEISMKVGFMSSTVFIRAFKKSEGITPGAYRKIPSTMKEAFR